MLPVGRLDVFIGVTAAVAAAGNGPSANSSLAMRELPKESSWVHWSTEMT